MKYRSEIDGLRAVAVIPVIAFHAGFSSFSGGFVGVDVFFVISGYLITTIILSEMELGKFSLVNFYEKRARRILPALFLVMFISLVVAWFWLLPDDMKEFSESLMAVSLFSSNIFFWSKTGYWDAASELKPLLHTWSLAVEEQYYVLFPLFLMIMWRYRKRWILGSFMILAGMSLALAHWGAYNKADSTFYLLPTRAWELAIGAAIAFYFLYRKQTIRAILSHKLVDDILGLLGLLMIIYSIVIYNEETPFPSLYTLVPTIGTGLIILFSSSTTLVGRLLSIKPLVAVGLISYSAYLWHQPLLAFARYKVISEPNELTYMGLAFLSFPLAYLSWRFVEKPFRTKGKFTRKAIFTYSLIGSLAFISIGFVGHLTNGLPQRLAPDVAELSLLNNGCLTSCLDVKKRTAGSTCIIGKQGVSPSFALLGDSHSTRLTKSLDKILRSNNKSMVVFSQSWCPPLIDFATTNHGKRPYCRDFMNNAFSSIENNSNIKTVFLHAEWANYTKGMRAGEKVEAFYTDSFSPEESIDENTLAFTRSLERTQSFLSNLKKNTILISSVPEYELHVPQTLAKLRLEGVNELPVEYQINFSKYQDRNKEVLGAFNFTKSKDLAITIIDAYAVLCEKEFCSYVDGNRPLYQDKSHLSYEGSTLITRELEKYINR